MDIENYKSGTTQLLTKLKTIYFKENYKKDNVRNKRIVQQLPTTKADNKASTTKPCTLQQGREPTIHIPEYKVPYIPTTQEGQYPPEIAGLARELETTIDNLNEKITMPSNITRYEKAALRELQNNHNITLKPADKGVAIVLQDREDYITEAERQLNHPLHYRQLPSSIMPEASTKYNEALQTMQALNLISKKAYQYLKANPNNRSRLFYLLPKIHKEPHKWTLPNRIPTSRPIVSDSGSATYRIAKFVDFHLAPFSNIHKSYVKNTYDFLDKIKTADINPNTILASFDVDQLYTNLPNELGLEAVEKTFQREPRPIHKHILKLLRMLLENNDFEFNNKHYLQVHGTSMGACFAPNYANISLAYWEEQNMTKAQQQPEKYLRYLDDIFVIWNHDKEQLLDFFNVLNEANPHIKLKHNIQLMELEFLDVLVFKKPITDPNRLHTRVFFKETDSHSLLQASSFHPKHTFSGIIKSQFIRFHRICSEVKYYHEACQTLMDILPARLYSLQAMIKTKKEILKKYAKNQNIPGITQCKSPNCKLCKHVHNMETLDINGFSLKRTRPGNCNTKAAIYIIVCKQCNNLPYVGLTKNIRARMNTHLSNIRSGKCTSVSSHFTQCPNSQLSFSILQIPRSKLSKQPNKLDKWLTRQEGHWISLLEAKSRGLNKMTNEDPGFSTNAQTKQVPYVLKYAPQARILATTAQKYITNYFPKLKGSSTKPSRRILVTHVNSSNKKIKDSLVRARLLGGKDDN